MKHDKRWVPKRGNSADEYEDAVAGDEARGRFAIADGATESSFAKSWALLLAEGFVAADGPIPQPWEDWLPPLRQRWLDEVSGKDLPWYAEAKLQEGAFATFLGMTICPPDGAAQSLGTWHAVAVGDGCLFQIRADRLHKKFPMEHAQDFGNTPWLIGSRNGSPAGMKEKEERADGDWLAGDRFLLMTDALAQWFLANYEEDEKPWTRLEKVLNGDDAGIFADWIEDQRDYQKLKNDDVTLLVINL